MSDHGDSENRAKDSVEAAHRACLTEAAQRALAEARERRAKADAMKTGQPKEIAGRGGPDPVRYGDWENKGIVSDF